MTTITVELPGIARFLARRDELMVPDPPEGTATLLMRALASRLPVLVGPVFEAEHAELAEGFVLSLDGRVWTRDPTTPMGGARCEPRCSRTWPVVDDKCRPGMGDESSGATPRRGGHERCPLPRSFFAQWYGASGSEPLCWRAPSRGQMPSRRRARCSSSGVRSSARD